MGLTHSEFFRTLPAAMGEHPYTVVDHQVQAHQGGKQLSIRLDPQQERRIALLRIPYTWVHLEFNGYSQNEIDQFMDYFNSRFQRGGG